ncbi:MAG TPA: hypothetical protein VLU43_12270 [Anaeromyxobacteraceae bacterium]|nr:hypothetical protein [Anaeromyxobacteraceae bacterium]
MHARRILASLVTALVPLLAIAQTAPPAQPAESPAAAPAPVAAPTPPAAEPAKPIEVKVGEVKFSPYGQIVFAGFFNDTKMVSQEYGGYAAGGSGNVIFGARQSRFGVRIDLPEALGAQLKGVIEGDFYGGFPVTSATAPNNSAWYQPVPRLRLAWGTAVWKFDSGTFGFGFGQEYGLAAPLFAVSSAYVANPLFQFAGNLNRRSPQLRLFGDVNAGGLGVNWAAAVLSPVDQPILNPPSSVSVATGTDNGTGNQSRMPDVEARVGVGYKAGGKTVAEVGVSAAFGKERMFSTTTLDVNKKIWALDALVNAPFGFSLRGELFTGQDLDSWRGNFDGAGVVLVPNPADTHNASDARAIREQGGWAQAVWAPVPLVQLTFGGGFDNPNDADLAKPTSDKTRNTMVAGGLILNPSKNWRAGVEWVHVMTKYGHSSTIGNQIALSSAFVF